MKQEIHPAVMATVIVIVVVLIAIVGYKAMSGEHSSGPTPEDMRRGMAAHPGGASGMMGANNPPVRPGSPSNGYPGSGGGYPGSGGSGR